MTEDELIAIILNQDSSLPSGAITLDDGVTAITLDDGTTFLVLD